MIKPAEIFADYMVLQREKEIPIWGLGDEKDRICVRLGGTERETIVKDGKWYLTLPAQKASMGTTLEISNGRERLLFHDVLIGEVWIAGGQSNMEFFLRYEKERKSCREFPMIRMYDCPKEAYPGQKEEYKDCQFGFWRTCEGRHLDYFPAVGYYFAKEIWQAYGIPVGIVSCTWGGTPACAWMMPEYLQGNEGSIWLEEYQNTLKQLDDVLYEKEFAKARNPWLQNPFANMFQEKFLYGLSEEELEKMLIGVTGAEDVQNAKHTQYLLPEGPKSEKRPGGLYENMLRKIIPYGTRGILWYQGENDDRHADVYHVVMSRLILCFREQWNENLPFLFVQLAPFEYWLAESRDIFPRLRKAQEWVSKNVEHTWMASIMDAGMRKDIHPKRKRVVGERLALLARGHVYGENIPCDAPECKKMCVEAGEAELCFLHAQEGLSLTGERINGMELYIDGALAEYDFVIEGSSIRLLCEKLQPGKTVCVRFAEMDYCEVNLYNRQGLSAKPFTITGKVEDKRWN